MDVFLAAVTCVDQATQAVVSRRIGDIFNDRQDADRFIQQNPPQSWTFTDGNGHQIVCAWGNFEFARPVFFCVVTCFNPLTQALVATYIEAIVNNRQQADAYNQQNPPQSWTFTDGNGNQILCDRGVIDEV